MWRCWVVNYASLFVMDANINSSEVLEPIPSPPREELDPVVGKPIILSQDLLNPEGAVITPLKDWGIGLDVHRDFVQVSAIVKDHDQCIEYRQSFATDLNGIKTAHAWVLMVIREKSFPSVDVTPEKLHYVIESTSSYHQIVVRTWKGIPSVINPVLAGATLSKTDVKDASRLAQMDLTGVWREFYIPSDDVACLRVLIAQRANYGMLATRISNQINSTFLAFGITIGRDGSVTRNVKIRALAEKLISDESIPIGEIGPNSIPGPVKDALIEKYALFDEYIKKRSFYEKSILDKAESMEWETGRNKLGGKKMLELLTTVPGVGVLTAVIWLANIITPCRFRSAKACSAYCGLDPSVQISAKHVTGRLVRKGNKDLHSALIQSASILIKTIPNSWAVGDISCTFRPAVGKRRLMLWRVVYL